MRVLLVEDDAMLGAAIRDGLVLARWSVEWVRDAANADAALKAGRVDAIVLDLGLPGADGLMWLARLRARRDSTPVLVATARDAVDDRIRGLDAGADDYLVKPFDLDELAARVRALVRRAEGRAHTRIAHGALVLDPVAHRVMLDDRDIDVSAREYALLHALLSRVGAPLSRAQLEDRVYGPGASVDSNAIEVHIHALRRKLGAAWIRNVRGVGWLVPRDPPARDAA